MSSTLHGADIFNATPLFDAPEARIQIGNVTNPVAVARALNLQEAGAQEEQILTYENAIQFLESKCQMLQETLEQAEKRHRDETSSLRLAVKELNAENEELANDVQELLEETEELQHTLQQVVRANLSSKESNDRLRQERESLLELLENTKYSVKKEDPQELNHWKSTMKRKVKLLTEDKAALENALSLANAEKDALSDEYAKLFKEFNLSKEDLREKKAIIKILQNAHQQISLRESNESAVQYEVGNAFFDGAVKGLDNFIRHHRGSTSSESCDEHKQSFIGSMVSRVLPKRGSTPFSSAHQKSESCAEFKPSKIQQIPNRSVSMVVSKTGLNKLNPKTAQDLMSSSCPSMPRKPCISEPQQKWSIKNEEINLNASLPVQPNESDNKLKRVNPFRIQVRDPIISSTIDVEIPNSPASQCTPRIESVVSTTSTHSYVDEEEDDDDDFHDSDSDSALIVGFRPRAR